MPVFEANNKKPEVQNIEISVDACAELGGQVYETILALRDVYKLTGYRNLTYVDTYQGFREKSDGTTPGTLFAFGRPHSRFGRFIYDNFSWSRIADTDECKKFSHILGDKILPSMTAPVVDAVELFSKKLREEAYRQLMLRGETTLGGKVIKSPDDIDIVVGTRFENENLHRFFAEPIIEEASDKLMPEWNSIVRKNSVLSQARTNSRKNVALDLINQTQESKAIAAALLFFHNPEEAARLGHIPDIITKAHELPSLESIRENAYQFDRLTFPKNNGIWLQPEVQQAIRYTGLWPWSRKPQLCESFREQLRLAHKNTADRAAVSYFFNELSQTANAKNTLYMLVTHDGPLIEDFINFSTGVYKKKESIRDEKTNRKSKHTIYKPVPAENFAVRNLPHLPEQKQAYINIVTGSEFLKFIKREQERITKKYPKTYELGQAMETLTQAREALEIMVDKDAKSFGLTKGGSFTSRIRNHTNSLSDIQKSPP